MNLEPLIQFTLFLKLEKPNIYISRWGDEKLGKCMWWVMQQSPIEKQQWRVVKLLNWDFLDLWKLKNHELLEKVEGERSSRTIEQTYKHTCRMLGMKGDTCTLREMQIFRCFAMHMSTSTNRNTKKHLEKVKEHLQIL